MMVPSARACAIALRGAVLSHVRLAAPSATASHAGAAAVVGVERVFGGWRSLAEAAGTYLDRGEVAERVLGVVKNFQKVDPAKVSPAASFQKDLGLDSLDTVEVVMAIEEEFAIEIPDTDADKIASCDDAINYIASHPQAK